MTSKLGTPLPRPRVGAIYVYGAAGGAILAAAYALIGRTGWGLAFALAALTAAFVTLPYMRPRPREMVQVDHVGVAIETGKFRDEIRWSEIRRVKIVTTSGGPWSEDVFFVLDGVDGKGCIVPHDAAVRTGLLEELQSRLPGVNNQQVVQAMGSTSDATFVIWEKTGASAA